MKLDMTNCILLVMFLLVSKVLLKGTNSPLVINFLNFVQLFCLQVLLLIILPVSFVILSHLLFLLITLAKILFFFVSQIKNANLSKKNSCFYNVASLFANIPLQETIVIAINIIFNHNSNLNITRKELFLFAASQTHFIFNSKFYNQVDGVAMVSPLAPVLPDIFM